VAVDTLGLLWAVSVTSASVQDRDGAYALLPKIQPNSDRLVKLYADSAYAGWLQEVCSYFYAWELEIVSKLAGQQGFVVLPRRWIVERSLSWFSRPRRLSKDYEYDAESSEAMLRWASVRRMLRRLTKPDT